jgi:hypothetical protein
MRNSRITDIGEINKRCDEVFEMRENDFVWGIYLTDDGQLIIEMEEVEDGISSGIFNYEPDMTERPEAVDYLMGERDDFND